MNLPLRTAPRWWALGLLSLAAACVSPSTGPSPFPTRAAAGDTVSLVQYYVRPDGRERFEQFVRESYWPAVQQVAQADSARARGFLQGRFVFPVRANADGSYTYVFILDPMVTGANYSMLELLQAAYPAADAQQRHRQWAETWIRPFTSQVFIQSGPSEGGAAEADSAQAAPAGGR